MDYNPNIPYTQVLAGNESLLNYKIPRREVNENVTNYTTPLNWGPPVVDMATGNYNCEQQPAALASPAVINTKKRPIEQEAKPVRSSRSFSEACPDTSDTTLPKELTSQFQPLYCKLCQSHLNSNVCAMMHYVSKNHEKRVRKFLVEHAERTGQPLHKRAKLKADEDKDENPRYSYCEVCDLQLTSKMHAQQHYMGRNHQKALVTNKPAGSGYHDQEGKWHRIAKMKDDGGRNGIGTAFAKEEAQKAQGKFYCTVCNVTTTSNEHLEMHYNGHRHQKMLKKLGKTDGPDPKLYMELMSPDRPMPKSNGASSCRTPSGQYYCQPCNITLNSEAQFNQHLDSKKHIKNRASSNKKQN